MITRTAPDTTVPAPAATAVVHAGPVTRREWDEVAAGDPDAIVTQTPVWIDAMVATGRFVDASTRFDLADGRRFVLPLARRRGPSGLLLGSEGFATGWGIGGLVGAGLDEQAIRSVLRHLGEGRDLRVQFRPNPVHGRLYASAGCDGIGRGLRLPRRAHVIDLRGGRGAAWNAFSKSARRCVRLGERAGVEVVHGNRSELLAEYQVLHERSLDRWAAERHEPAALARFRARRRDGSGKWATIARELGPSFTVWIARLNGEPLAAMLLLSGPNAHETRAAVDRERSGTIAPSYLLTWLAIEQVVEAGAAWYHLGESGTSSTLSAYKERFGAVAHDYAEHRFERLPVTRVDTLARSAVKRMIGFKEAS